MFSIRSKLVSLLQPWLQSEPDLELKLGFLRSHGIAKDLRFDISVLNRLIGDSTFFSFEEVRVQNLNVRFSPWSFPALKVEFSGISVKLTARKRVDNEYQSTSDLCEKEKKAILSVLDPEGTELHDAIERISVITSTRNWCMVSFLNVMLKHCQLLIRDIHVELQLCVTGDTVAFFMKIKEFSLEALHYEHACLLKGLIGAIVMPQRVCSLTLKANLLEAGLKRPKNVNRLCFLDNLSTCIKLKDLQLLDLDVCTPRLNIAFTPIDISILEAFNKLTYKEVKRSRKGRELWNIAASRIDSLTSDSKLSLHKLVGVVMLWLRYVHSYESLLSFLGYPAVAIFEKSSNKMSLNKRFSIHVKNQLKVVSEIEKDLSVEILSRARRIARQRAAVHDQYIESRSRPHQEDNQFFFWKILSYVLRFICFIFQSVMHFFSIGGILNLHVEVDGISRVLSIDPYPHYLFNFREVVITVCPLSITPSTICGTSESPVDISHLNLLLFCVTIDAFFLYYTADNIAQSLSLSCGDMKVKSSPLIVPPMGRNLRESTNNSFGIKSKERLVESKVLVWAEPAPKSLRAEKVATDSNNFTGNGCFLQLRSCLEELWLNVEKIHRKFGGSNAQNFGNPFFLCEIKSSLMDQCIDDPDIGIWKCNVSMGRLNVDLGHSSIISMVVLQRQIQHPLHWFATDGGNVVGSQSLRIIEPDEIKWEVFHESYTSRIKMAMLRTIPENKIKIGIAIAGPKIRMSLRDGLYSAKKQDVSNIVTNDQCDFYIAFNLENIQLSVWPTPKASLRPSPGGSKVDDERLEDFRLNEQRFPNILGEDLNEKFVCQGSIKHDSFILINGLTVYMEDLEENQQYQLIGLKSISIKWLSCREYTHSFTGTVLSLSNSLCGMATGAVAFSYMDEFEVFLQVVECLLSALSCASKNLRLINNIYLREVIWESKAFSGKDIDEFTQAPEKGIALIIKCIQFSIDASFEFGSIDIVMHSSRKNHIVDYCKKAYRTSSNNVLGGLHDLEYSIAVAVQNSRAQILLEEASAKTSIDFLGLQFVVFRYQSETGELRDVYDLRNLLHQSTRCLYELSLTNFSLASCASSADAIKGSVSGSSTSSAMAGPSLAILGEGSDIQSCSSNQSVILMASNLLLPSSGHQLVINIAIGEIIMAEYSTKVILIRAHQQTKLVSSLCVGRERHTISWSIQGGLIILEMTAVAMFVRCFSAYLLWIQKAISILSPGEYVSSQIQSPAVENCKKMARSNDRKEWPLGSVSLSSHRQSKWELLEALRLSLSQISLALVFTDGSGEVGELLFEADFQLNFESMNSRRKLLFDLSRLTVISQHLHEGCPEHIKEIQTLHFSPVVDSPVLDNELSPRTVSGDVSPELRNTKSIPPIYDDACSSGSSVPQKESRVENDHAAHSHFIQGNYILNHAAASVLVEKASSIHNIGRLWSNIVWTGRGSISGLDFMISLSEIQMVLSLIENLSGDLNREVAANSKQRYSSMDREQNNVDNVLNDTIPDGAIVAIQDLHQHTYFAVESIENNHHVIGTMHYSLVGERALFRVKYCNKKGWGSAVSWFTLTSLQANSGAGEPLRLNYRPGSGYVEISSNNDNCSLWRTLTYKPNSYEAYNDFEFDSQASKSTFYLVNKKCDCAVAFIDGIPEFVKKPGNLFKVKLFPDVSFTQNSLRMDTHLEGSYDPDVQHHTNEDEDQIDREESNFPYISITIDKVSLTIVHVIPDSNDKFPLLRACIDNIQIIVQVLCSKFRLISTSTAAMFYFDAQGNLWREIVHPVEICIFYRYRFEFQSSEIVAKRVPVHFYFRTKQVNVFLTELSLDILLFVVGELGMAGPFAVRSSIIFANCCKIENQSSLRLHYCFYDNQSAIVPGKRSSSILIRPEALATRQENSPFLSIQLAAHEEFITSPIQVALLNARLLAWRTRVTSLHDSRSFPGPFIVVDVSKRTEDGLSVAVSPLLRIHNQTGFSMEIRFWRPQQKESESATVLLKNGDTIDDSMAALDAINLYGGSKKVLMSLILGNFLFSCRPEITECSEHLGKPISADWSEDLKGGKAVCLSGVFDKLSYRFKQALGVGSVKISFSTLHCSLNVEGAHISDLHFLVQTIGKDVPVVQPDNFKDRPETRTVPVALQEQKEIFLLPTVQVSNHLQTDIHVLLSEINPDLSIPKHCDNIGKQATISCGSTTSLYANPSMIYFVVTLTAFKSSCKAVNSGDWANKLQKNKNDVNYLDINLEFGSGKYFASLRLSRSDRGILEATVFTSYVLQNNSDLSLICLASDQKPLSRLKVDKFGSSLPPDLGTFLPPKSTRSWFVRSNKISLKLLEEEASIALLDLDVVSGFTEVCLETHAIPGVRYVSRLGISLRPWETKISVPSQIVSMVPRYVISNETAHTIFVRQHYLEEDIDGIIAVNGKQKAALRVKTVTSSSREVSVFDSLFRKHKHANEDYLIYIQFRLYDTKWSWSGPICVSSLGRFFLKFRRPNQSSPVTGPESKMTEFAVVHVVQEGSSLVLCFDTPPDFIPQYRIENALPDVSITYCQKDSMDPEILGSGSSVGYVWDDLRLPHQLIIQITDINLSREINMDKVRAWKPLFKVRQQRGFALEIPLDKKSRDQIKAKDGSLGLEMLKVGYEVYADGATRVLRISEFPGRGKEDAVFQLCAKIQFRVSNLAIHLLENKKQEENANEPSLYSPVVVARFGNINLDSMFTDQNKYNRIRVQSINVDEKWVGAPFAALLRRNEADYSDTNGNVLQIVFILLATDSGVKKVKYSSTILQPVQLNLDEETLMRFVPFWRTSLSDSTTQSQQFYFEHFEIHPIKVVASFLPGSSDTSYSSAQETLRSFLHSIIKIPAVKNKNVELNGILLTHALVTVRELFFKCAQHYSWYGMRAVYIAKGSPLLPPAFASIFDDSASSSLDIFFDPSSGLINLPGITIGMFKFISKCIDKKGFSGTKRYFGDLGKTVKTAGSNVLFAAVTEISDCVLKGAEVNGFNGMVNGFHQGILKLAMEPSVLGTAVMEGGPDRKIKLDRSPGVDELYIEGYLQAMLDTIYKQEYLRVRVLDNQVILKNLPPNSSLMNEIMDRIRSFLISKALLQGEPSATSRPLRHLRGESEWKIGPTLLTLWEHLFVSFAIRILRKQAFKFMADMKEKRNSGGDSVQTIVPTPTEEKQGIKLNIKWGVRKFVFSGVVAYLDGRLCRRIPNAVARRIGPYFSVHVQNMCKPLNWIKTWSPRRFMKGSRNLSYL